MSTGWIRALNLITALSGEGGGGVFYAFSTFVRRALHHLPAPQGIAAMQSMNVTVIRPPFMTAFLGTGGARVVRTVSALLGWHRPAAIFSSPAACPVFSAPLW